MAYTQAQVDALEEALASGTLRVKYADREVTYRSLAEMRQQLASMKAEISPKPKKGKGRVHLFTVYDRGY